MKLTLPVAVLFAVFGSGVSLRTVAVSFTSTALDDVKLTVIVVVPPAGSTPRSQVIVAVPVCGPDGNVQVPLVSGATVTAVMVNVPLLRIVSVRTTLRASDGPRFSTVIAHV